MAEDIRIQLEDIYKDVTDEDIRSGKNYVLRRERAAQSLSSLIDDMLADAAEKLTLIAYRYGINPEKFRIASSYNEKMFDEMSDVLDSLEDEILDMTVSYATRCTDDDDDRNLLMLLVLALGKDNKGLRETLDTRLWMFSRDVEAMIAATKAAGYSSTEAVLRIRSSLHAVYTMPEVKKLFGDAQKYAATYIRSRGVKYGNMGSSNSEANNILRFSRTTVQMGWMEYRQREYAEDGAAGYITLRGSSYPCRECDSHVGVHPIDDKADFPPFHANCCCYAVPVYEKGMSELMQ